ncbi:MAG: hypothetical protein M0P69_19485 [Bacteroidales bacterium]|jgi:hypothetical protein|nr:hypothetical protein [Bacteroidales bacterium]
MEYSLDELDKTLDRYTAILQAELRRQEAIKEDLEVTKERIGEISYILYTTSEQRKMMLHDKAKKEEKKNEV